MKKTFSVITIAAVMAACNSTPSQKQGIGSANTVNADTIGLANPKEVGELFTKLRGEIPANVLITGHFHDTRGMALANIYAALEAGINRFDSSAGGLGGCPFAPGASGNVATEDVVFMCHEMGITTGIDLRKLKTAVDIIKPYITRCLDSKNYKLLA